MVGRYLSLVRLALFLIDLGTWGHREATEGCQGVL